MLCYTGCTTKHLIADTFARDKSLQTQVKRYLNYKEYAPDVINDFILYILELNSDEKLIQICRQNNFNYWLFNLLKRQHINFDNKYKQHQEINDSHVQQIENSAIYKEEAEHKLYIINLIKEELSKIENKNWYNAEMFNRYTNIKQEYANSGLTLTYAQFGKEMNIDKDSLFQVIKKVKDRLKKKIDGHL